MIAEVEQGVATLGIDEIVSKLQSYRGVLKQNMRRTDELMVRALRNLKRFKGSRLMDLNAVMEAGGVDNKGRPKLAIGRADWEQVQVYKRWRSDALSVIFKKPSNQWRRKYPEDTEVRLSSDLIAGLSQSLNATALVPIIPAEKLPVDALSNYWILWEAVWSDIPPHDPYLLKRIDASNLFVVIDQWDLTEIERMVMRAGQRATR